MRLIQDIQIHEAAEWRELIRESLQTLVPVSGLFVWAWTVYTLFLNRGLSNYALVVFAVGIACSVTSYALRESHLDIAVWAQLVGLFVCSTLIVIAVQHPAALYLYLQVVLVASALAGPRVTWGTAVLSVTLVVLVGIRFDWAAGQEIIYPAFFILFSAVTIGVGERRLYTALAWSYTTAQYLKKGTEEARTHRAEIQRVKQSLDIAYTRLERANQALVFAQDAAERAYRFKSEFVANVSHELRTPLNLIVGFSEMMATAPESYGGTVLPSEYRGDVMAIYRSAHHLLDLINDVLDLSQIEASRMAIYQESVDLQDVIHEAVEIVRGLAEAKGLALELNLPDGPLVLALDRTRIRQVLLNLLTNAMRYTDVGWIRVSCRVGSQEVSVAVEDTGEGIEPEKLGRAFEAFGQLQDGDLRAGSGLGLALSKKFVELHGGRMWIESKVARGTQVGFVLPLTEEQQKQPRSRAQVQQPLKHKQDVPRILVVHDDQRVLTLLRRHIGECDFAMAKTVKEAKLCLDTVVPHAILVDSFHAGREPLAQQAMQEFPQLPIISCPLPNMHQLGMLLGATGYLPKPVTRDDLAAALARLPQLPRTALVVDDNPQIVRLIGRMLRAVDPEIQVWEAYNGQEGLDALHRHRPDVVFLDLVMPKLSGYGFLRALQAGEDQMEIPVFVVSVRSVEQESAHLLGGIQLERGNGFTLTEILQLLRILSSSVRQADAVSPANAAALLVRPPG